MAWQYLIALGSNMRHPRFGGPANVLRAAVAQLDLPVLAQSAITASKAMGPSRREFSNGVLIAETAMEPLDLLEHLQALEVHFGRVQRGERWGARVLDLDIILWSGGIWASPELSVPHTAFRDRNFVLGPACSIAPNWRDPVTGFSLRHLKARLDRKRPRP